MKKKVEVDYLQLNALLQFKATKRYCAKYLGISEDTIERRIREQFDLTFKEYADEQLDDTRLKLQNKAISMALKGNTTMLIFTLKNICNWTDRVETNLGDESAPLKLKYALDNDKIE